MPHDNNGKVLKVGDIVLIPARITVIQLSEEYCNLTLSTLYPMAPSIEPSTLNLNATQVIKN